jgi:hypothetical protein
MSLLQNKLADKVVFVDVLVPQMAQLERKLKQRFPAINLIGKSFAKIYKKLLSLRLILSFLSLLGSAQTAPLGLLTACARQGLGLSLIC